MDKNQNTVPPTPTHIPSTEARESTRHPLLPSLLSSPAESQAECSSRGLALIFRDKESQVLDKCLIRVSKPFLLIPSRRPLRPPSQAPPRLSPPLGSPPFPHSLGHAACSQGRGANQPPQSREGGCHSHTRGPSTPTGSAGSTASNSQSATQTPASMACKAGGTTHSRTCTPHTPLGLIPPRPHTDTLHPSALLRGTLSPPPWTQTTLPRTWCP